MSLKLQAFLDFKPLRKNLIGSNNLLVIWLMYILQTRLCFFTNEQVNSGLIHVSLTH